MTRHRFSFPLLFLLALALLPATSSAQDLAQFWQFSPKPGNSPAFAEALRAHVEYRKELGDPWSWYVFEMVTGKDYPKFYVASWDHTWADLDAYDAWEGGAAASAHFQATVSPLVEKMSNHFTQSNRQMEKLPDDPNFAPTLVNVTTFFINPAKQGQFNETIMKFHEAIVEADMPFYYSSDFLVAGGEGPVFSIAGHGTSWADFADPDPNMEQVMIEHYGEEEAMEIFTAFGESIHHWDSFIVRARPDLSLISGM
jgi:hypothetical protein